MVAEDQAGEGLIISGVALGGYRSFRDTQYIGPMRKVTVLSGRNNSGKSNILRFLGEHYSTTVTALSSGISPEKTFGWSIGTESPLGLGGEDASFGICVDAASSGPTQWAVDSLGRLRNKPQDLDETEWIGRFLSELGAGTQGNDAAVWRVWRRGRRNERPSDGDFPAEIAQAVRDNEFLKRATGAWHLQVAQSFSERVPLALRPLDNEPIVLSAFRQVEPGEHSHDGSGLIPVLADLKTPDLGRDRDAKLARWEAFEAFVRSVLERNDITLTIPATRERLIVEMDGRSLDLADLGTGIHEVIIIAAAATAAEQTLVLLEEPEIHLHPLLQKRLLNYLCESTTNQYVLTTHSAHFLDFRRAAVFQVTLEDGWTQVSHVATNSEMIESARDLGYRPSDLLQADAVIWVEGPSDRVYLRYWLGLAAPELLDGVDYVIMFYGGRLASNLSGLDSDFALSEGELIELRRLNRRSAIVMDSDHSKKGSRINATKSRLKKEFERDGFAWVTKGREIENYIHEDVVLQAIQSIDPNADQLIGSGPHAQRWRYRRDTESSVRDADKMRLARAVIELAPPISGLDLPRQVEHLAAFLRQDH